MSPLGNKTPDIKAQSSLKHYGSGNCWTLKVGLCDVECLCFSMSTFRGLQVWEGNNVSFLVIWGIIS